MLLLPIGQIMGTGAVSGHSKETGLVIYLAFVGQSGKTLLSSIGCFEEIMLIYCSKVLYLVPRPVFIKPDIKLCYSI